MPHDFQINDEDTLINNRQKKAPGGIVGWLMKSKIISTPGQANAVLVLFVIVGLCAIVYINLRTFGG